MVRDAVRRLPDGEKRWQELQGHVYGAGVRAARPFAGVAAFLARARAEGADIAIVSHKTRYGHGDPARVDLRAAALDWMMQAGFFAAQGIGLATAGVHFAESRKEKLERIAELGCAIFIDDLEEVLSDPAFPPRVERILFSPEARHSSSGTFIAFGDWSAIEEHVFGVRGRAPH
ncbi:MAG: hypothetical protein KIT16_00795 [Rhodospirillaceae bacterium]|nr:hypothetical protein [Rhodospirillaceae bacterium]